MTPLDLERSAWVVLKQEKTTYIESMMVIQEKEFEGEMVVLGWNNNGMGVFPREHVYQTKQEATEAGYKGKVLTVPEGGCGMPWFLFLAPKKGLEHLFILQDIPTKE